MLRLRKVETALANFFASGLLALGPALGPVLWQLPPRLGFDEPQLEAFLEMLPRTTAEAVGVARGHDARLTDRSWVTTDADRPLRHALEVRDESFRDPAFLRLLERQGVVARRGRHSGPLADARHRPPASSTCACTAT